MKLSATFLGLIRAIAVARADSTSCCRAYSGWPVGFGNESDSPQRHKDTKLGLFPDPFVIWQKWPGFARDFVSLCLCGESFKSPAAAAPPKRRTSAGARILAAVDSGAVNRRSLCCVPLAAATLNILGVDTQIDRPPGLLASQLGWEDFVYEPDLFAPMTDQKLKEEGWA